MKRVSSMINKLKPEYIKLSDKFLQRSLREQILILGCGFIVVILLAYTLFFEPLLADSKKLQNNSASMTRQLSDLTEQIDLLSIKFREDPDAPVLERIKVLEQQLQSIVNQLLAQTKNLVPANKMAGMLESVLTDSKGLRLIELQSIAPVPILIDPENEQEAGLYRHGVTLVFEGSYFDIQRYLEKVEALPWQFYWKKFDYLVAEHPQASVELEIYTLSTNKAFIGI